MLGATDGLVSVASLMIGVGAVRTDAKPMLLAGFAGSVAGAFSMAIGEFVFVYTRYEAEVGQMRRDMNMSGAEDVEVMGEIMEKRALPNNPFHAAFASASTYSLGALAPLLAAALIENYHIRLMVVVAVASLALLVFGWAGAVLGKTQKMRSCVRVLVGGWMAMAITFGLTKLLGSSGFELSIRCVCFIFFKIF